MVLQSLKNLTSTTLRDRVRSACTALGLNEQHPIAKVPLHVYCNKEVLDINSLVDDQPGEGGRPVATAGGNMTNDTAQTILIRLNRIDQNLINSDVNINTQLSDIRNWTHGQFRVLNNNIRAYGGTIQGALVRQRQSNSGTQMLQSNQLQQAIPLVEIHPATLSNNPKSLPELWNEFKFGIDGKKPAQQFTTQERNVRAGGVKQKYYRRNHVWQAIDRLVRSGDSIQMAFLKIHQVYGHSSSVSTIVKGIIKDKQQYRVSGGIHPNLC